MRSLLCWPTPTWSCWCRPSCWRILCATSRSWSSRASARWSSGSFCSWAPPSWRCSSWSSSTASPWRAAWPTPPTSSPWSALASTSVWPDTRVPQSCWGCSPARWWDSCACPWAMSATTPSMLYLWGSSALVCCSHCAYHGLNAPCFSTGCGIRGKRNWQKWPANPNWTKLTQKTACRPPQPPCALHHAGRILFCSRCCLRWETWRRGPTWGSGPCGGSSTPPGTTWCCSTFTSCGTKSTRLLRTSTFTTGEWRQLLPCWVRHL